MLGLDTIDRWHAERWGRFTASEIYKLMAEGKKGEFFGAPAITYIRAKAVEAMTTYFDRPELEEVKSLLHGRAHEWPAFERYRDDMGLGKGLVYYGTESPLYASYNEYSGGSPDGLLLDQDVVKLGLEIKCPKNPSVHFNHLELKNQWDLKAYSPCYYGQCQFLLMIFKAPLWHWASYDERYRDRRRQIHIIEVRLDKNYEMDLKVRLKEAQKRKLELIEKINKP